jgi:peptidyl-prolyl cis-trans isomerase SurA
MEPAMRNYLTTMREQAFIDIKPGYTDTGASPRQTKPIYSAYAPPTPKKKKKVERTRFRESTRTFRQKSPQAEAAVAEPPKKGKKEEKAALPSLKPGKREKIRFGQAPSKTLPKAPEAPIEDAGAVQQTDSSTPEPVNPLETNAKPTQKTRYSARAKQIKQAKTKAKGTQTDAFAPVAPDTAEVADRQTQAAPLGLAGDTSKKKKKVSTTTGNKTRLAGKKKSDVTQQPAGDVPLGPAPAPAPQPQQ